MILAVAEVLRPNKPNLVPLFVLSSINYLFYISNIILYFSIVYLVFLVLFSIHYFMVCTRNLYASTIYILLCSNYIMLYKYSVCI